MSASPEKRQRFINVFADIRDELIQHFANEGMPDDGQEWFRRVSSFRSRLFQPRLLPALFLLPPSPFTSSPTPFLFYFEIMLIHLSRVLTIMSLVAN